MQPAPASPSAAPPARADVDGALATAGPAARARRAPVDGGALRLRLLGRPRARRRARRRDRRVDRRRRVHGRRGLVFGAGPLRPVERRRPAAARARARARRPAGRRSESPGAAAGQPLDREAARVLRAEARRRPLARAHARRRRRGRGRAKRLRARAYTVGSRRRLRQEPVRAGDRSAAAGSSRTSSRTSRRPSRTSGVAGTNAPSSGTRAPPRRRPSRASRCASARGASGVELHKFGEPDNTPDLTFVSTSGKPGFLDQATAVPPDVGPLAAAFNSMQALLATLAAGTGTIGRLRIVSHANFDNIFTPLFDGGVAGDHRAGPAAWGESDVAGLRRRHGSRSSSGRTRCGRAPSRARRRANPAIFATFGIDPGEPADDRPGRRSSSTRAVDLADVRALRRPCRRRSGRRSTPR